MCTLESFRARPGSGSWGSQMVNRGAEKEAKRRGCLLGFCPHASQRGGCAVPQPHESPGSSIFHLLGTVLPVPQHLTLIQHS